MVTKEYDVLINDFNRGKWLPSKLDGMGRSMVPCTFCGAKSKGRWRAPEVILCPGFFTFSVPNSNVDGVPHK